jgi:alanine-glyoxylate transaminase/(R)-3-amino-2-methylpropionate-pyruvate transaminase
MKSDVSETLTGKMHFLTFGADPYQTAQAKAVLDIVREEKLTDNAQKQGAYLVDGMKQLMKTRRLIGDVRGRGLLLGMELVKDRDTKEHATAETIELMEKCRDKGLLVGRGGLMGNVLRIAPPLTITKAHCDTMLRIFDECLGEIEAKK